MSKETTLWKPREDSVSLRGIGDPAELAPYAKQLTPREMDQIVQAFSAKHYELATNFVWTKAMASLKQRLGALGNEFVGEMLDRPDLRASTNLVHSLSDLDALKLGEELGMFNSTQAMRLRTAMATIQHFTNPPDDADPEDGLDDEEAITCLKTSIQAILGHERLDVAVEFARFRSQLEETILSADSLEILALVASPYFFRRTTLRVLLALLKNGSGIQLENASGNFSVVLPALWDGLLKSDRYDVGRSYAEVHAAGRTKAASGIRRGLMKVQGFDYVPENLRSLAFVTAANVVLDAHFGYSNFHNEPRPMKALADMGSTIPSPALSKCMTATLCVQLGNQYGISRAAQSFTKQVLDAISVERWTYYLQDCLPADDLVLSKLEYSKPVARWIELVTDRNLQQTLVVNPDVQRLLSATAKRKNDQIEAAAKRLLARSRQG